MDDGLKQRLIGALVIVTAAIIFIPMLFDDTGSSPEDIRVAIPQKPDVPKLEFSKPRAPSESTPKTSNTVSKAEISEAPVASDSSEPKQPEKPVVTASGVLAWAVQLASFEELTNAETLRDKLRGAKYKAYIKYRPDKSPALIQVFVGPELKRTAIDKLQRRLQSEYELQGIVVRYVP